MKVMAWYSRGIYPLDAYEQKGLCRLAFWDEEGMPCDRVLLTGVSGTGKTTVLQGIEALWQALQAQWQGGVKPALPVGQVALLLEGITDAPVLCICARERSFWDAVGREHPDALAAGWVDGQAEGFENGWSDALGQRWRQEARKQPNILRVEDFMQPAAQDRESIGEALLALQTRKPERSETMLRALAALLYGKRIEVEGGTAQVRLDHGGTHVLEALSAGEQRIVRLLIAIARDLHPGGVLLIDETESHLHPSQVLGLITTLEQLTLPSGGQLILTSHMPEVWRRYNSLGVSVTLEGRA